jgi:selenide,water dikinase
VHAMTDVTGFGLLGHLVELADGASCTALLDASAVPLIDDAAIRSYVAQGCVPGGTNRNFAAYGHRISDLTDEQRALFCDPQTSGGLLVSVDPAHVDAFVADASELGLGTLQPIGAIHERSAEGFAVLVDS